MKTKWPVTVAATGLALLLVGGWLRFKAIHNYAYVPARSMTVPRPYPRAGQAVDGLAFSPDGKMLAVADTQTGMSMWSVPELNCSRRVGQSVGDGVSTVHWSPTGSVITLADSSMVHRWDVHRSDFMPMPVKQAQFSRTAAKKEYWNAFQLRAISPSGTLAAGADAEGDMVAWNLHTGQRLFSADAVPSGKIESARNLCDIAFSPDDRIMAVSSFAGGMMVASSPLDIVIRSVQTGKIMQQWQWKEAYLPNVDVTSGGNLSDTGLVFSPDGSMLAAADTNRVAVWDTKTGKLRQTLAATERGVSGMKRLLFFHNGQLIAGAGWGDVVPVWNIATGNLVQTFHSNGAYVEALAVSPDDKWLATGEQDKNADGKIKLWDMSRLLQ